MYLGKVAMEKKKRVVTVLSAMEKKKLRRRTREVRWKRIDREQNRVRI